MKNTDNPMPEPASDTRRFYEKRKKSAHDGRTHQPTENQRLREQTEGGARRAFIRVRQAEV